MSRVILELPSVGLRPCYRIDRSYSDNAVDGPDFSGAFPQRPPAVQMFDFLGYPVASPLGVPAGPLLNSQWIAFAAQMGFDIVAYKTMRSEEQASHPVPNVVFVEPQGREGKLYLGQRVPNAPSQLEDLTITNSFGNPSKSPEFLQYDIQKSRHSLGPNQVLIVSAFGSGDCLEALAQDYLRAAHMAEDAGAHVIELNFSCPNLSEEEGALYTNSGAIEKIAGLVVAHCQVPVILKVGVFDDEATLHQSLLAAAKAGVRAVCGLNTIPMKVVNADGSLALGPERPIAGVCGGAIRLQALDFVRQAHAVIRRENLGLTLLGCGGITLEEHFDTFLDAGADIVMSATGMMWDPYLAMRWHYRKHEQNTENVDD